MPGQTVQKMFGDAQKAKSTQSVKKSSWCAITPQVLRSIAQFGHAPTCSLLLIALFWRSGHHRSYSKGNTKISYVNLLIFGFVCFVESKAPDIGRDWNLFLNCALDLGADGPDG